MSRLRSLINGLPWEILNLVSQHLDPKTLAVASCVSKSWLSSMSSDHLWQPICTAHYPSLSNLKLADPSVPYRRLYALGLAARNRRLKPPSKPRISLQNLLFAVDVRTKDFSLATIAKPADQLCSESNRVFRFDVDVDSRRLPVTGFVEEVKITWNVVLRGWEGVFTMIECKRKLRVMEGGEGWLSEELPSPGCCSSDEGSGMVGDLRIGFCRERASGGEVSIDLVSVGILSTVNWRYVSVDDGLRYLQHFLPI